MTWQALCISPYQAAGVGRAGLGSTDRMSKVVTGREENDDAAVVGKQARVIAMVGEAKGTMSRPSSIGKMRGGVMARTGADSSNGSAFDDDEAEEAEAEAEAEAVVGAGAEEVSGNKTPAAEAKKVAVEAAAADDDGDGDVSATVVGTDG